MTFSAKYDSIDEARAAAARSYERPAGITVFDRGGMLVGQPATLSQSDVDQAHDALATMWEKVKLAQHF